MTGGIAVFQSGSYTGFEDINKNDLVFFDGCKHWKTKKVSVNIVRELYGVMKAKNADRGIVVTYGSFTQDASDFAKEKPIELVNGRRFYMASLW